MSLRVASLAVGALSVLWLAGCGTVPGTPTEPKLSSEDECIASPNRARCKLAHDLAGGYPFALDQSRD